MIVYLHGFNSSPQSAKAQYLKRYLDERGKGAEFVCPQLPHRPDLALGVVEAKMAQQSNERITLIASSLGGFYATWLPRTHDERGAQIHPARGPHVGLRRAPRLTH